MKLSKIEIKNIYHMLCYSIDELKYFDIDDINIEDISGTHELLAHLLYKCFIEIHENGYIKRYTTREIVTDKPYGKIGVIKSYQTGCIAQGKLVCDVDSLDINNRYNQLVKSALWILIDSNAILNDKIPSNMMSQLYYMNNLLAGVDRLNDTELDIDNIYTVPDWYKSILVVCKLIFEGWLACDTDGNRRLLELNDKERLKYIFEKFVRSYYADKLRKYYVSKPTLAWGRRTRQPDALIEDNDSAVMFDMKWYESSAESTRNEDQITTDCVAYHKMHQNKRISASLLYATSDINDVTFIDEIPYEDKVIASLYTAHVAMNQDFEKIKKYLDLIFEVVSTNQVLLENKEWTY